MGLTLIISKVSPPSAIGKRRQNAGEGTEGNRKIDGGGGDDDGRW